jgi:Zinc finger, C3HC4 type (RING finger)
MEIDKVNCKICLSMLCRPVSMPCGHNFCKLCVIELIKKSIYHPRCCICKQKITGKFEVNKTLESALAWTWPSVYKKRLEDPSFEKELNVKDLWTMSIFKTAKAILLLICPMIILAFLYRHATTFPRVFLRVLHLLIKFSKCRSTSFVWHILWAVMHMIVKYLEANSILSNIAN